MKTVNKPIEMIATMTDGKVTPIRFRINLDGELQTYNVQVKTMDDIKQDKERILVYNCEIQSDERILPCEIRFYVQRTMWMLCRI